LFINALNVDETVGQLLASEGFRSVEELAHVDQSEIASIEGFDEETAQELQNRARNHLAMIEAEHDAKRKELGVEDALLNIDGVTMAMLVKFGENGVKTIEDLADCATDDLTGWTERKDGQSTRHPGALDGFDISREQAEAMIMTARQAMGWIEAPAPAAEGGEAGAEAGTAAP
jgi:transcription termination/antitermination protein NusA